jgi:hypothetical protein
MDTHPIPLGQTLVLLLPLERYWELMQFKPGIYYPTLRNKLRECLAGCVIKITLKKRLILEEWQPEME